MGSWLALMLTAINTQWCKIQVVWLDLVLTWWYNSSRFGQLWYWQHLHPGFGSVCCWTHICEGWGEEGWGWCLVLVSNEVRLTSLGGLGGSGADSAWLESSFTFFVKSAALAPSRRSTLSFFFNNSENSTNEFRNTWFSEAEGFNFNAETHPSQIFLKWLTEYKKKENSPNNFVSREFYPWIVVLANSYTCLVTSTEVTLIVTNHYYSTE